MQQTETAWPNSLDLRGICIVVCMNPQCSFILGLCLIIRFIALFSTKSKGKLTSLDQYIKRMKSGQKDILYLTGVSKEQLEKSPFLERLIKKNYEVQFVPLSC